MWHKEIDHNAAHLSWGNQFLHLISSILMLCMFYVLYRDWAIGNLDNASLIMVVSQTLRQGGHFFVEGNVSANEKLKIGYNTNMKYISIFIVLPALYCGLYYFEVNLNVLTRILYIYMFLIASRVLYLTVCGKHCGLGMVWFVKIVTDVVTDLPLYGLSIFGKTTPPICIQHSKPTDKFV